MDSNLKAEAAFDTVRQHIVVVLAQLYIKTA